MKQTLSKFGFAMALAIFTLPSNAAQSKQLDTAQIDELTGLKGKLNQQENVYKVSSPRTDLKISVDKWEMPPFMGLTSWAAFMPGMKGEAMVMGDLVLMQDEGDTAVLAKGVRAALDTVKKIRATDAHPAQSFTASSLPAKSSITAETIQT